jgi:hypothetical protein
MPLPSLEPKRLVPGLINRELGMLKVMQSLIDRSSGL